MADWQLDTSQCKAVGWIGAQWNVRSAAVSITYSGSCAEQLKAPIGISSIWIYIACADPKGLLSSLLRLYPCARAALDDALAYRSAWKRSSDVPRSPSLRHRDSNPALLPIWDDHGHGHVPKSASNEWRIHVVVELTDVGPTVRRHKRSTKAGQQKIPKCRNCVRHQ